MKKTILFLGLLLIGYTVSAQVLISLLFGDKLNSPNIEFGLDGGVNYGNIANLEKSKMLPMFNLGFYFDIRLKNQWMLHTGVIVKSSMGADNLNVYSLNNENLDTVFATGHITRKVNQFAVPIMIKYRFATYFHVEAGPMLSLRTKGYDYFKNKVKDDDDLSYKLEISDNYKRIDAGIMVGAGFKLSKQPKSSQMGIRYYYSFVDPVKDNPGKAQYFSSLYLYFSLPIGANPKEPKEPKQPKP
jgi:hypothetical protein